MSDFKHLTPENINMFAIKHYDNPSCVDEQEFLDDMKRFKYLKRLFRKFDTTKELKSRLIINHIIVLANVFGPDAAKVLLFYKVGQEYWSTLKTFLIFLKYMETSEAKQVNINPKIMEVLRKI